MVEHLAFTIASSTPFQDTFNIKKPVVLNPFWTKDQKNIDFNNLTARRNRPSVNPNRVFVSSSPIIF